MENSEYGVKGDWWVRTGESTEYFIKGKLYQMGNMYKGHGDLIDEKKNEHGFRFVGLNKFFRKATKQELINNI